MLHHSPLIATIVGSLVFAFILGTLAFRLRLPPLIGYLCAGIVAGPFTPGFTADSQIAPQLAEMGVILLMFGVGLHFSVRDLLAVKTIALPGAIGQILLATVLGLGMSQLLGWPVGEGVVFGLALSTASTVVLLKALQEKNLEQTDDGKIAIGWLVVEDLVMVLTLVLLPIFAGVLGGKGADVVISGSAVLWTILLTLGKVAAFVALMLVFGRRFLPWMLERIVYTGSRELFRLAVLSTALGVAYGASLLFDVSFALGAFFAGMVLAESPLSHRAAEESLPLRDAFSVLFFVSVGMLLNPSVLLHNFWEVLGTLLIIVVGKSLGAYGIVRLFGRSPATALTIAASLAQIGEFSFILAGLGITLGLMNEHSHSLILAGAILSILLNPLLFLWTERYRKRLEPQPGQ